MIDPGSPLIEITDLVTEYVMPGGLLGRRRQSTRVLENLNLTVYVGETLGVVGESGCGKSTLANSLIRLIEPSSGQVLFNGQDLLSQDKNSLRQMRRQIQMVFQNPFSSLNPRMTVHDLVAEPLITHSDLRGVALAARVQDLLLEVGLDREHLKRHPHQLSGGQAQRVAVARALALNPKLLVLDEPTSALDVSVQAQIINLLEKLQHDHGLTYLIISHDLSVVQHFSDRIAVMYLGEIVELATTAAIFEEPQHPYTQALLSATPLPDPDSGRMRIPLEGNVPSLSNPPAGCRFHTRCPYVLAICREVAPSARVRGSDLHWAACHLLEDETVG